MTSVSIWIISFVSIASVIAQPFKTPELTWAAAGAVVLLLLGLIIPAESRVGMTEEADVYLFLAGMMLLAETARSEKLFDRLAAHATNLAEGSANYLFGLIYLVGNVITAFSSNDATAWLPYAGWLRCAGKD
ncbi:SLC13 family permease [Spirosoma agri]|uniref:Citrate transporter-like domain-containing protein n=1 Tax=Spirosoma agri TaxID=1987381 RepID=A0A6M0IS60_9BACT|nr:SLC13 family permease [Spirosoma agri]NEU70852.1 hypothetical protein [Spirosoma agri]